MNSRTQIDQHDPVSGQFTTKDHAAVTVGVASKHYSPFMKALIETGLQLEQDVEGLQGSEFWADLGNRVNTGAIDLMQLALTLKRADPAELKAFRDGEK